MANAERHEMSEDASLNAINATNESQPGNTVESTGETKPQRPEWLQEKFQTPEDMAKAYAELEKKLGGAKEPPPEELTETAKQNSDRSEERQQEQTPQPQEGNDAPFLPGMENTKAEEISQYAWENRELSEEHYKTLQDAGYSRDLVDQFMSGQFAQADDFNSKLLETGGGEANVQAMFDWAANNMDQTQVNAYNEMFDKGGAEALMAMENLRGKYSESGQATQQGHTISGANAPSTETSVYHSSADVIEAMNDPRYSTNPTYREEVARKLARSNVLVNGRA